MALMRCEGLDSLIKKLDSLSTLEKGQIEETMLLAGSQDVKRAWIHQIEVRGLERSRLMKKQITSSKPKTNIYGMFTTIYPQGWEYDEKTGKKRVRNAEKAFYLHYGFYNHQTNEIYKEAVGWINDVENEAFRTATATMNKIFENYIKSKG